MGVAGAAFSVVHARLVEQRSGSSLMELVGPVMATVVLPYRGREASARELERPVPELPVLPEPAVSPESPEDGADEDVALAVPPVDAVRPTRRTLWCSRRLLSVGVGIIVGSGRARDIPTRRRSRGCWRGCGSMGWLRIVVGGRRVCPKAWWLTASGEEFLRTGRTLRALSRGRGRSRLGSGVVRGPAAGALKRGAVQGWRAFGGYGCGRVSAGAGVARRGRGGG